MKRLELILVVNGCYVRYQQKVAYVLTRVLLITIIVYDELKYKENIL